ncbi:Retrovirus-related Pol polyprotein from transposon 297 [Araneus ventricosus]|uniref:Retrovirus-related Pol polyprotein from transposon 297 n=1 Tax=Araneus ventricosus TaxID=182803 RepID=A0A4Y2NEM9_ARAVE|nr:Retrovirus-related Pol polyprotein from transposon 297 [Araneus ventricosus]GBN37895.1 Retrovirus-related Pol polyprotein from transposon 297 [Araneus ventricosus]
MPFGLCNAPATFERLMETVLRGLSSEACLVYLDDIIIVERTFEEHLNNLRKALPTSSGYDDGLHVSVICIRTPVSVFLALQCIPETTKSQPKVKSHEMQVFPKGEECEKCFNSLKQALISSPILTFPRADKDFILDTDASNEEIGALLSQNIVNEERVIAYFSKSLGKPERNYCVTRKELLAIVKSIEHFHHYLYGQKFFLRTDHASLRWLLNFKEPEGQIARWIQRLQESAGHEVTGLTPVEMLFGRTLRLPCDILFGRPSETPSSPNEYMKNLEARLESVHAFARGRIKLASIRMKTRYVSRATDHHFEEGDLVWMYNPKQRRGLSPKLQ